MIKKWNQYIKEDISKRVKDINLVNKHETTKNDIYKKAIELIDDKINDIFVELHQDFNTISGDISPDMIFRLKSLQEGIAKIISDQVHSNMGDDIKKVRSIDIDLDTIRELTDEREEVKDGDDIIMVIFNGGYSIYSGVVKFEPLHQPNQSIRKGLYIDGIMIYLDSNDVYKVIKVETYNDFCEIEKRIPEL